MSTTRMNENDINETDISKNDIGENDTSKNLTAEPRLPAQRRPQDQTPAAEPAPDHRLRWPESLAITVALLLGGAVASGLFRPMLPWLG